MIRLSDNFTLAEATASQTAARLGLDNQPTPAQLTNMRQTAAGMEVVRLILGVAIHVSSWLRRDAVNAAVGGAKTSAHRDGWAVDFTAPGFGDPLEVCRKLAGSTLKFDQLIHEYGQWTHISFEPRPMRRQLLTIDRAHGTRSGILPI